MSDPHYNKGKGRAREVGGKEIGNRSREIRKGKK